MFTPGQKISFFSDLPHYVPLNNKTYTFVRYNTVSDTLLCVEELFTQLKSEYCFPLSTKEPEEWL